MRSGFHQRRQSFVSESEETHNFIDLCNQFKELERSLGNYSFSESLLGFVTSIVKQRYPIEYFSSEGRSK